MPCAGIEPTPRRLKQSRCSAVKLTRQYQDRLNPIYSTDLDFAVTIFNTW
jgi:hypothetical protein